MRSDVKTNLYNSTYKVVAADCDWGAASVKAVTKFNGEVNPADLCGFASARQTQTAPLAGKS